MSSGCWRSQVREMSTPPGPSRRRGPPAHVARVGAGLEICGRLPGMGDPSGVTTLDELAELLRDLRRRQARRERSMPLSYRELAARTGWSHSTIGEYLAGRVLPPTDRFDALIRLLGAAPAEQGALAAARDRVEEHRRLADVVATEVPRQLPADIAGFAGRAGATARLDEPLPTGR